MNVADRQYFQRWLKTLRGQKPERLWRDFTSRAEELPALNLSTQASAVYSSNIEGNSLDLNSFLHSKMRGFDSQFKVQEREEIELLIAAYGFAQTHALSEKNFLMTQKIYAAPLLPKASLGKYRTQMVYVYSRAGMEYAAVEPEHVPEEMRELFAGLRELKRSSLNVAEIFYHAALLHLMFVHIHPFMDGNGRAARLLEKWFLATHLGRQAWHIPSEFYYKTNKAAYYKNIKLGLNFYTLNYERCIPFLTMLVKSLAA
jgi:Fic family protein